jgi:methionyl-tRNA formyltransferase
MKVLFAGTPEFAEAALASIIAAGHQIVLVLTREDQPAGRGQRVQFSPVKQAAIKHQIALLQPRTLRDPALVQVLANQNADVMVVAAYGRILPAEVLRLPRFGCINIHASVLPRWRGAAPIQRAIEAGDEFTGITIMQMDEGLDTGDILSCETLKIGPLDNAARVHDDLMAMGAASIVSCLAGLQAGTLVAKSQPEQGVTYAKKIEKSEGAINWALSAVTLHNKIRAFDPYPGCSTRRAVLTVPSASDSAATHQTLKIWRSRIAAPAEVGTSSSRSPPHPPGTVLALDDGRISVQCGGDSRLELLELQKPGGKRLPVAEFLKGYGLTVGERFIDTAGD